MKITHTQIARALATTMALAASPLFAQDTPPPGAPAEARERMMRETRERMQKSQDKPTPDAKPWRIGLMVEPVEANLRNHLDLPEKTGVIVTQCMDGGPAAKAGIKKNDIILAVNGRPVASIDPLRDSVNESAKTGKELRLSTLQKGQRREVVIKPDMPKPDMPKPPMDRPRVVNPSPMQNPAMEGMMRENQQMVRRMAEQNKELVNRLERQEAEMKRMRERMEEMMNAMRKEKENNKKEAKGE